MFREALHEQEPTDDDKMCSAILDNWKITIGELSDELGLSFVSVQSILTEDLGIKLVSVKFVPKLMTVEQKVTCLAVTRDLLPGADQYTNFMKTIITGDESWICGYDPETKGQSSQRKTGISKAKNGPPSSEQGESDVDNFL
jgi:hypothetical protein